jgi:hypothetical protein
MLDPGKVTLTRQLRNSLSPPMAAPTGSSSPTVDSQSIAAGGGVLTDSLLKKFLALYNSGAELH